MAGGVVWLMLAQMRWVEEREGQKVATDPEYS